MRHLIFTALLSALSFSVYGGETATFEGMSTNDLQGWESYRVRLTTGM